MDHAGFTLVVTSRSNFSFVLWELKAFSTLWMSKFFTGGLHNERSSLNYAEEKITCTVKRLTVRTLKPGDLKEDCSISTFSENKRFSSFFCKRPITFINWTCRFPRGQVSSNGFKFLSVAKWNTSILLFRFQKKFRIFCFQKTLWLENLLPSVPVWVSALQSMQKYPGQRASFVLVSYSQVVFVTGRAGRKEISIVKIPDSRPIQWKWKF